VAGEGQGRTGVLSKVCLLLICCTSDKLEGRVSGGHGKVHNISLPSSADDVTNIPSKIAGYVCILIAHEFPHKKDH
jgi:hypothetical protein